MSPKYILYEKIFIGGVSMNEDLVISEVDDVDTFTGNTSEDSDAQQTPTITELEDVYFDADKYNRELKEQVFKDLLMSVDTNISIDSVILAPDNKAMIEEFILEQENKDKLLKYGLQPMNRLLFYGASGCGKTYLGKALSNHLHYSMLYVDIAQALSKGNVADNLSNVFKLANTGRYMIFLDECDSIAWNRDADDAEGGNVRRATNSLFQFMDQMNPDVIIICATNMLKRLDPAFERRFNMKMEFKRPNTDLKETVRKFLKPGFNLVIDRVDQITERRTKLSYYELQCVTERVMKKAVINNTLTIKMSDIYKDIAKTMHFKINMGTDKDADE